jgi:guanosine-3',5'-bis(diphosphate) 3'-pyrophosphohydrolase
MYQVALGKIDIKNLKEFVASEKSMEPAPNHFTSHISGLVDKINKKDNETLLIGDELQKIDYTLSPCCNPIPGDDVFGFITVNEGIKIHRTNCPNASKLMANYGYRILKAKWTSQKELAFLTGLDIVGIDDVGLVNKITTVISHEFKVNIRSITISSNEGIFEGSIMVFVNDTEQLDQLIKHLKMIRGITGVTRFNPDA